MLKRSHLRIIGFVTFGALGLFQVRAVAHARKGLGLKAFPPLQRSSFYETGADFARTHSGRSRGELKAKNLLLDIDLRADRQSYDEGLKRFVAEGQVSAVLNGGILQADRIEVDSESNILYALGSVRFFRGSQYLQASSLRYDLSGKRGVLKEVYGVIDLETVRNDLSQLFRTSEIDLDRFENEKLAAYNSLPDVVGAKGIACPPRIQAIPDWHPHPWALTAWGGKMTDANFGKTFFLKGNLRPEYLLGLGIQKRIHRAGPFAIELEADFFNHNSADQKGGRFNQSIPYAETSAQNFQEGILGIGARVWVRPWLSFSVLEGVSYNNNASNYERTFRDKYSKLLNYLSFEIEAALSRKFSVVGRIHHRSGAFGFYNGTKEGSNAYLLGLRYRWGKDSKPSIQINSSEPIGCSKTDEINKDTFRSQDKGVEARDLDLGNNKTQELAALSLLDQEALREKEISKIDQRINSIKLNEGIAIEGSLGSSILGRNVVDKNRYGGIRVSQLIRKKRNKFISGSISRWRFQAANLIIDNEGWRSDRISFTNDPFTPGQTRIDAKDVVAIEEENGDILIKSSSNRLVLEERLPIPILRNRRIKKEESVENYWVFGIDNKDRDGFYVGRNLRPVELNKHFTLFLQPQILLQRANQGETRSYVKPGNPIVSKKSTQQTKASDLFGLDAELVGKIFKWDIEINSDISSFNSANFANGSRYWADASKKITLPGVGVLDTHVFGAYRYRAWNGTLGETTIYSAYGSFLEKRGLWKKGRINSNYILRLGGGEYQSSLFDRPEIMRLWKTNLYGSMTSIYPIWSGSKGELTSERTYRYSPIPIRPGLVFLTNLRSSIAAYGDGNIQKMLTISGGPSLTLGRFDKSFLSYTKLSITGGTTFKQGSSPFVFDRAVDLATLGFGWSQQIAGPLLLETGLEFNIDETSEYYGELVNSNIELRWQRRSYDLGLYFNPSAGMGGFRIKLNDFGFQGTGIPFVPLKKSTPIVN